MKTKSIFILFLMYALYSNIYAQNKDGSSYYKAIRINLQDDRLSFTDVKNTASTNVSYLPYYQKLPDDTYQWTEGNVVYYRFETTTTGDIIIHNWGSDLNSTNLFLVTPEDPLVQPEPYGYSYPVYIEAAFEMGDFYNPSDVNAPEYASESQGYIYVEDLPAGVYYIIAGGYKGGNMGVKNGNIRTTIIGHFKKVIPGEPSIEPERPNTSPVQYHYDTSGNRTKTIKK